MTPLLETTLAIENVPLLIQLPPKPSWVEEILSSVGQNLGTSAIGLVQAILILLVGWIVAGIIRKMIYGLLKRTDIDNKIASWITGQPGDSTVPIEQWIAEIAYWLVILFTVIAALETLKLQQVSQPLRVLLESVTGFLPQIGGAAILVGLAWLLATLVKLIVTRTLRTVNLDERLGQQVGETPTPQFSLSDTIGNTLYWFIFLLFLPSILSTLQLEGTLEPVQDLLNQILAILPNILAGILIAFVGWSIAQVIRRIVTNLLAASGADRLGARFGLTAAGEQRSLSWILGTVVYVLVLIPVSISALNALQIDAISEPAIAMLEQVLVILPQVFTAALILVLAYLGGNYVSELVASLLVGLGFNNVLQWLGLSGIVAKTTTTVDVEGATPSETPETKIPTRTPSELAGTVVLIAIMLVATLAAVDILQIPALTEFVQGTMQVGGQVLVAMIIFAVGLYLANWAFNLISSSGNRQARIVGHAARIAVIALVSAMSLRQIGIASDIVNLAFGLLLGGIAVAIAIAFGWGGRDIAAEQIRGWIDDFNKND
ncbi:MULTISPECIES: mechanosensitive ion channel [Spirulina sp. CCY15215]|uniref:mechanosensitive ion channel n=1 Tax=Spirulina sp. CCY15215 TaxID=2767591 RepID=UPI00194DD149|nr:mechanosensitive ion channel [Spirulina major]